MPDQLVTIEVDGKRLKVCKGSMLIEVTDEANINVPRFCYHKKLSVAANCRMCMVEVEKSPKPVPACATPVMDGMKVFTKSNTAKEAQKATMEFLLINHPLDCPICDQGGECELQDLAVGYGSDVSRYAEQKRVVKDKNIGPLIQTDLTRCIHCTRCIRFGDEVAGMREMGATGRGENMQIGTYIEKAVSSELSGNIIDLCPVGALTSKPYRYSARAWELRQHDSIAPHDAVGSNLHLHVKGNVVKRVVPKENEAINEVWISDRDRFSYEGLNSSDRLEKPMIKRAGKWIETDWQTALDFAVAGLKKIAGAQIGTLASPTCTLEELFLLQKLMRQLDCNNIDHRLMQTDFTDQEVLPAFPWLGMDIADIEELDAGLIIGSNIRQEQPLLNYRIHKTADNGAKFFVANPADFEFNWEVADRLIQSPSATESVLAGIAKALLNIKPVEEHNVDISTLLDGVETNETDENIAASLVKAEKSAIFVGQIAAAYPNASKIRALAGLIAELSGSKVCYLAAAANTCGAWLTGVIPHRGPGAKAVKNIGANARTMFEQALQAYVLLGTEPELDSLTSAAAVQALNSAEFVVSIFAFHSEPMMGYADVILPMALFAETSGTFINGEGKWQSFSGAVKPRAEARPAWKIMRVLGNLFELEGFDYNSSEDVLSEIRSLVSDVQIDNHYRWPLPKEIKQEEPSVELFFDTPLYFTDPLVRRATALQKMENLAASELHINPTIASRLRLHSGELVRIKQSELAVELMCVIDERVPPSCAMWRRGFLPEPDFAIKPGAFILEKVS